MRTILFALPIAIFGLKMAFAGFRHPVEQTGEQAVAVQSTPVVRVTTISSGTSPSSADRHLSNAPVPPALSYPSLGKDGRPVPVMNAQQPAPAKQTAQQLPQQVKPTAQPSQPVTAQQNAQAKQTAQQNAQPQKAAPAPVAARNHGPVPKAPSLPEATQMKYGDVNLPKGQEVTVFRDAMPAIEYKAKDRSEKIHSYSRQARMQPLPSRDYSSEVQAKAIVEKYKSALSPIKHTVIRTPLSLKLETLAKITLPAKPAAFRQMVKRIDALFDGIENLYPRGVVALWELSRSRLNPEELRARDSLFAGLLSQRAGWETVAASMYEASAEQQLQEQERYVAILWNQLDGFTNPLNIDRVVNRFDVEAIEEQQPLGDRANLSLAKKALRDRNSPMATHFGGSIKGKALHDRFELLRAVSALHPRERATEQTRTALQTLADTGDAGVRDEARLTLARINLREGSTQEALALYNSIEKNGVNRLEVMAEQSYVEFLTGNHPAALGKAIGAESKFFQYGFSPDVHLVETLSRKANCDFGGAEAALRRFADRYIPELAALDQLTRSKREAVAYYNELISYHSAKEPMRYQRYLLRLPVVMENQKLMNQAERDLEKIDQLGVKRAIIERPAGWDKFAATMRSNWDKRVEAIQKQSGENALKEAAYMADRLRSNFAQAELMGLDVSTTAAKDYNLQNALNFPVRKLAATEPTKEQVLWPFEQEIWEDELDSLRMKNPSKCALSNKPAI